ncbi:hypothetical protein ABZ532_13790 [Streptomyces sp. NPDC019396]|uniref:hypothetical protein n=1 Tax=Streptomyces sp. NPDC019396 TaxID=3154687 RepID=UPI0033F8E651
MSARHPDSRLSATMLRGALDGLAAILDERFLHTGGDTAGVFASSDHGDHIGSPPTPRRGTDA